MITTEKEFENYKEELTIFDELIGKTFNDVVNDGDEELKFLGENSYKFFHVQDCCEYVRIEDICGDLDDLIGSEITVAEGFTREAKNDEVSESGTWTFYKFATNKGSVTVRWIGESNGYYSESVYFREVK